MTTISSREARVRLELVDQLYPGEKPFRLGNVPKKIEALLQKQEGFFFFYCRRDLLAIVKMVSNHHFFFQQPAPKPRDTKSPPRASARSTRLGCRFPCESCNCCKAVADFLCDLLHLLHAA